MIIGGIELAGRDLIGSVFRRNRIELNGNELRFEMFGPGVAGESGLRGGEWEMSKLGSVGLVAGCHVTGGEVGSHWTRR